MNLLFITCAALLAVLIAITKRDRDTKLFCILWTCYLVAWVALSELCAHWVIAYGGQASNIEYSLIFYSYYLSGAALSAGLLCFLYRYNTEYGILMAVPIALNAFLCLLIPIEEILFRGNTVFTLLNIIAEGTIITELTLLAMGSNGISRIWKRRTAISYARLQPLQVKSARSDIG